MAAPAVFLDRDGVLTESTEVGGVPRAPLRAAEMRIYPEARGALERLREAGFRLVCISNQPEIARGNLDPGELEEMERALDAELDLDAILVCPHDDADECDCRKPKPGMLLEAADRLDLDLTSSFTVGDRWRDVEAGRAAGTTVVFVDRGYEEALTSTPDAVVSDVEEASTWIIERARH